MSLSQGDLCLSCSGSAVELGFLLPYLAGAVVEGVVAPAGLLLVLARARAEMAACRGAGRCRAVCTAVMAGGWLMARSAGGGW